MRRALPAGDYSVVGLEEWVAVERKSVNDLVTSLTRERARFLREMERFGAYDAACVVVEAELADVAAHRYRSRATPRSIVGSVITIGLRYRVPTYFCGSRSLAAAFTERYLVRYAQERAAVQVRAAS